MSIHCFYSGKNKLLKIERTPENCLDSTEVWEQRDNTNSQPQGLQPANQLTQQWGGLSLSVLMGLLGGWTISWHMPWVGLREIACEWRHQCEPSLTAGINPTANQNLLRASYEGRTLFWTKDDTEVQGKKVAPKNLHSYLGIKHYSDIYTWNSSWM